jgi:hypothetical protein
MDDQRIEPGRYGGFSVYEFGTYPRGSVLAGQTRKRYVAGFDDLPSAKAAHPAAEVADNVRSAHNTYDHLPGEDDPVPGGMYLDDI